MTLLLKISIKMLFVVLLGWYGMERNFLMDNVEMYFSETIRYDEVTTILSVIASIALSALI